MVTAEEKQFSILVVDDDEAIRSGFSELLNSEGYRVHVAKDTNSAYNLLNQANIDLVITDILMPGESGLSLIQEIMLANDEFKIICISGGGKDHGLGLLKIAQKFGAIKTLQKPISADNLIETVKKILIQQPETQS